MLELVFDDFIRFIFPSADLLFDMGRGFTFLEKELSVLYPESRTDTRFVDKLVQVCRKNGKKEWVLIHIEVQGGIKRKDRHLFAERMFRYFYRIYDRYQKPVEAVVIFTGRNDKGLPRKFNYQCLNTRLEYQYNTLSILEYTDEELENNNNPFALVIMVAKQALLKGKDLDRNLLNSKLFIFRKLYEEGIFEKRKLQAILMFLDNYVRFEKQDSDRIFKEEIDKITGKTHTMDIFEQVAEMRHQEGIREGIKEGFREGRTKERENSVRAFLVNTEFPLEKIAGILGVSVSFVKKVKAKMHKK